LLLLLLGVLELSECGLVEETGGVLSVLQPIQGRGIDSAHHRFPSVRLRNIAFQQEQRTFGAVPGGCFRRAQRRSNEVDEFPEGNAFHFATDLLRHIVGGIFQILQDAVVAFLALLGLVAAVTVTVTVTVIAVIDIVVVGLVRSRFGGWGTKVSGSIRRITVLRPRR